MSQRSLVNHRFLFSVESPGQYTNVFNYNMVIIILETYLLGNDIFEYLFNHLI